MGEMADYYLEQELLDGIMDDQEKITRVSKWLTKDGRLIAIRDMSNSHLINLTKLLNNKIGFDNWLIALEREQKRRKL